MAIAVTLLLLCFSREVESSLSLSDKILELPGQPQVGFQQYSGYVAVDEKQQGALFYYFAEAETDPAIKPLVLWLNGGLLLSTHYLFGFCGNAGMWGGHGFVSSFSFFGIKGHNILYSFEPGQIIFGLIEFSFW